MIDVKQACDIYTDKIKNEIIASIFETNDYYLFDSYHMVKKADGSITQINVAESQKYLMGEETQALCEPYILDNYLNLAKEAIKENQIVKLYATAWNKKVWYGYCADEFFSKDKAARTQLIEKWTEIEQILYGKILQIIDSEDIVYPQCCLDHMNDFYRIKPIMVRNGYTDDMNGKHWELM